MSNEDTRIFIEKIAIHDFRAFSGKNADGSSKIYEIELGEHITCISGHNGIGKSTILAMLSNCGELKVSDGRLLNGDKFSGEYSEIIKFDEKYDKTGDKCTIYFGGSLPDCDSKGNKYVKKLDFRATIQIDKNKKRYRLLPKRTEERNTERKIEWPTYYLGLSRLYPIGESENVEINKINDSIKESMLEEYSKILNMPLDKNTASNFMNPSDAKKKKGVGIKTDKYGFLSNSSGQDNLGQILTAIFSFEKLKKDIESRKAYYDGGILLIDEIDATLHPAAQNKLFRFLYKKSKELNLQIVFTTHSLSLLEYITEYDINSLNKSLVIQYLTNARGDIEISTNPTIQTVKQDLTATYSGIINNIKIDVLTEDETARWFLDKILNFDNESPYKLNFYDCNFGFTDIAKLIIGNTFFRDCIVIFDPDITQNDNKQKIKDIIKKDSYFTFEKPNKNRRFLLTLPGNKAIETIIWEYIDSLRPENDFFKNDETKALGVTKRSIEEYIDSNKLDMSKLQNQKLWFSQNNHICNILVGYWIQDNKRAVDAFIEELKAEYNKIAKRKGIKVIL